MIETNFSEFDQAKGIFKGKNVVAELLLHMVHCRHEYFDSHAAALFDHLFIIRAKSGGSFD